MGMYSPFKPQDLANQPGASTWPQRQPSVPHDRAPDDVTRAFNRLFPPEKAEVVEGDSGLD